MCKRNCNYKQININIHLILSIDSFLLAWVAKRESFLTSSCDFDFLWCLTQVASLHFSSHCFACSS